MRFAQIEDGAVGYVYREFDGEADVTATVNGEPVTAGVIGDGMDFTFSNMPPTGVYFVVPESEPGEALELEVRCVSEDGEMLYYGRGEGQWLATRSDAMIFLGNEVRSELTLSEPAFEIVDGEAYGAQTIAFGGTANPYSVIRVLLGGEEIASVTADEEGRWQYAPDVDALTEAGDCAFSFAEDGGGSEAAEPFVYVAKWAALTVTDCHFEISEGGRVRGGQSYEIYGAAEPEETVQLLLNGETVTEVTVSEFGDWIMTIPEEALPDGETSEIVIRYKTENREAAVEWRSFVYDAGVERVVLNDTLRADSETLSGTVEPGAEVTLTDPSGETVYAADTADERGRFRLDVSECGLTMGAEALLVIRDEAGNVANSLMTVASPSVYAQITAEISPEIVGREGTLTVTGTAQVGATLLLTWETDGAEAVSCPVENADGSFSAELTLPESAAESLKLTIGYSDTMDRRITVTVPRDLVCELSAPETVLNNQVSLELTGEPGAQAVLLQNGREIAEGTFDENGALRFMGLTLSEGDVLTVAAADALGNEAEAEIRVEAAVYAELLLRTPGQNAGIFAGLDVPGADLADAIDPVTGALNPRPYPDGFHLEITGEPGETVHVVEVQGDVSVRTECLLDENGCVLLILNFPDGRYELYAEYAEAEGRSRTYTFIVDTEAPVLTADAALFAVTQDVAVRTEPGARTAFIRNSDGAVLGEATADENGAAVFAGIALEEGEYTVTATDAVGNTASAPVTVTALAPLKAWIPAPAGGLMSLMGQEEDFSAAIDPESGVLDLSRFPEGVVLEVEGQPGEELLAVVTAGGGETEIPLIPADDGRAELILPALPDGETLLTVRYVCTEAGGLEYRFITDTEAPEIGALQTLRPGRQTVTVQTEPGAQVALTVGDVVHEAVADETGAAVLENIALTAGEYRITATDENGNSGEALLTVAERRKIVVSATPAGRIGAAVNEVIIGGLAEAGARLQVVLSSGDGESLNLEAQADESGSWVITIDAQTLAEGETEVTVSYAEGDGPTGTIVLTVDSHCELTLDTPLEGETVVRGWTESFTPVLVTAGGATYEVVAADNGRFAVEVNAPLTLGETVSATATDEAGNEGAAEVVTGMLIREDVQFEIVNTINENGWYTDPTLTIAGTAEPDTEIELVLGGAAYSLTTDGEGRFSQTLQDKADDAELTLEIRYADGLSASCAATVSFRWDNVFPALTLDQERVDVSTFTLSGTTDPGQRVTLFVNGEAAASAEAGSDGAYSFRNLTLRQNDLVRISAADAAGNETMLEATVQAAQATSTGELRVEREVYAQGDSVRVQGWLLCAENDLINIFFEVMSGNQTKMIPFQPPRDSVMSPEDFAGRMAESGNSVNAETGIWIDTELQLDDQTIPGAASIRIVIKRYPEWEYIESETARFTVEERQAEMSAEQIFVDPEEGCVIALDEVQPADVFGPDNILLIGWFYCSEDTGCTVSYVTVAPANAPDDAERIQLEEVSVDDMPAGNAVCYLDRDVRALYEQWTPGALDESIVAANDDAGFIVSLDLDLPDGDYIITLGTQVDGPRRETAEIRVTVQNGQGLSLRTAMQYAERWAPAEP